MERWKINTTDSQLASSFSVLAISGIGSPDLAKGFLEAMQTLLGASHCTVFALEADGRVSAVSTASAHGVTATSTATEYVRLGFDRKDSNMVWLAKRKTPGRSQTWLSHQRAEEVADLDYRRVCYAQPGIRERTSMLLLLNDGRRVAVSFYRNLVYPPFSPVDFDLIECGAPILREAVLTHLRVFKQDFAGAELYGKVLSLLANRERQVIAHVLAGRTTQETAEIMNLSSTTVLTYRYRAFAKLGVRTQRELLSILNRLPANLTRDSANGY